MFSQNIKLFLFFDGFSCLVYYITINTTIFCSVLFFVEEKFISKFKKKNLHLSNDGCQLFCGSYCKHSCLGFILELTNIKYMVDSYFIITLFIHSGHWTLEWIWLCIR